jgi:hypothetical protein
MHKPFAAHRHVNPKSPEMPLLARGSRQQERHLWTLAGSVRRTAGDQLADSKLQGCWICGDAPRTSLSSSHSARNMRANANDGKASQPNQKLERMIANTQHRLPAPLFGLPRSTTLAETRSSHNTSKPGARHRSWQEPNNHFVFARIHDHEMCDLMRNVKKTHIECE